MTHIPQRFLALNTVAMCNAELTSGIEVYSDETSEVYGSSKAAAKEAIGLTVIGERKNYKDAISIVSLRAVFKVN